MSQARILGIVGVVAFAAAAVAYAQTTVTPVPNNAPVQQAPLNTAPEKTVWGDAKAGATKAGTCAACHGLDGNPTDPQYPRLAGQSERFIAHQIALFKSGDLQRIYVMNASLTQLGSLADKRNRQILAT